MLKKKTKQNYEEWMKSKEGEKRIVKNKGKC